MATTRVVVAHQTGARFMEHRPGFGRHLTLVKQLEHPEGRKKSSELDTDRAGASASSGGGTGGGGRSMSTEHSAHQHVAAQFAKEIADELKKERAHGEFNDLILVAEPRFLGLLRGSLDSQTAHHVVSSVSKDLASVSSGDVAQHIRDVLPL